MKARWKPTKRPLKRNQSNVEWVILGALFKYCVLFKYTLEGDISQLKSPSCAPNWKQKPFRRTIHLKTNPSEMCFNMEVNREIYINIYKENIFHYFDRFPFGGEQTGKRDTQVIKGKFNLNLKNILMLILFCGDFLNYLNI